MKFLLALVCFIAFANAQIHNQHIQPISFTATLEKTIQVINLPSVNVKTQLAEEKAEMKDNLAPRYGYPHFVKDSVLNSGNFQTLSDGSRVWRLTYISTGAFFTMVEFDKFKLAKGATLHIVTKDREFLGAYTDANNKVDSTFGAGPIKGDEFTLELFEPKEVVGHSELRLSAVTHSYKDLFGYSNKNGRSGTCNVNVACPEARPWTGQVASVALMLRTSGFRFCTGAFINNIQQDGTPYFLTAAHCGTTQETTVVMFNYEGSTCRRGSSSLTNMTVSGFDAVARNTNTDVNLVKLRERIPESYNAYLSGFNAIDSVVRGNTYGIHHPSGDNKKFTVTERPVTQGRWGSGPDGTHWRVQPWTRGTTEPGSSGSPLFDSNKRIIGQLHGGTASCRNMPGYDVYGKLARSWIGGSSQRDRLRDHLDPKNTGVRVVDGAWLNQLRK